MQYCPKCRIQIRGRKACCPLCQREVISFFSAGDQIKEDDGTLDLSFDADTASNKPEASGVMSDVDVHEVSGLKPDADVSEVSGLKSDSDVSGGSGLKPDADVSEVSGLISEADKADAAGSEKLDATGAEKSKAAGAEEMDAVGSEKSKAAGSEKLDAAEADMFEAAGSEKLKVQEHIPRVISGAYLEEDFDFASEDPFVHLPLPQVSFTLMMRIVAFLCVSSEIILGAFQVITGFSNGWVFAVMGGILIGWADILLAVYYRNNIIRMLNTQAYVIMAACLVIDAFTGARGWAISWVVPSMFLVAVFATSAAGKAQNMELNEYILYPAFNVLMSLLQIIPIALGINRVIAPAVICIAMMLILVSGLIIFRGSMLRDAAAKYLHI